MKIYFHKHFGKKFKKLSLKHKETFYRKIEIFSTNPFSIELNNHPLKGRHGGYRSINITGDIRAVFKFLSEDSVEFDNIDNHNNLYK